MPPNVIIANVHLVKFSEDDIFPFWNDLRLLFSVLVYIHLCTYCIRSYTSAQPVLCCMSRVYLKGQSLRRRSEVTRCRWSSRSPWCRYRSWPVSPFSFSPKSVEQKAWHLVWLSLWNDDLRPKVPRQPSSTSPKHQEIIAYYFIQTCRHPRLLPYRTWIAADEKGKIKV